MPIPKKNYLTLRLVRLQRPDEWNDTEDGLSFILMKGGRGTYTTRNQHWDLASGDVVVAGSAPGAKLTTREEAVFWEFTVCLVHLMPLFSPEEISLLQTIVDDLRKCKQYASASPLAQECHRLAESAPPAGNIDHRSQMLRVAAAVLAREISQARTHRNTVIRSDKGVARVFESLSIDELLTFSVGDLAAKFNCSRRNLNRLFHQHFGHSVAALRMEIRLLKAVSLLRNPETKVIDVAEQCGFNHLGLFNKCFKRRFGSSPGRWRKTGSPADLQPLIGRDRLKAELRNFHQAGHVVQAEVADTAAAQKSLLREKWLTQPLQCRPFGNLA